VAPPVIEAQGLVRRFGTATVLAGVDLRVNAGEIVAIFGPNGAGKTTLLRILATVLAPTAGTVSLFGSDAFGSHAGMLRRRLGLLAHESFLYPDLTATENLLYYARLYRLDDGGDRAAELLGWAGLEAHRARPVRSFSRGMTQRLALARALLHRPELLLLDEPFSGLDAAGADAVEAMLVRMRDAGGTTILTTHDVARGLALSARACILNRGRLAWESPGPAAPDAFADAYRRVVGGG
jgi:heme exporter protein A